jgi:hypothetical protein
MRRGCAVVALSFAFASCKAVSGPSGGVPDLVVRDGSLVVKGAIDKKLAEVFAAALRSDPNIRSITITSAGGDAREGLRIGRLIAEQKLEVIAEGVCASACAQYIFLAGARKTVQPGAVLLFHSSPTGMARSLRSAGADNAARLFEQVAAQERELYRSLGIREDLGELIAAAMIPVCVAVAPGQASDDANSYGIGWKFSAVMLSKGALQQLGVRNVEGDWPTKAGLVDDLHSAGFSPKLQVTFINEIKEPSREPRPLPRCGSRG